MPQIRNPHRSLLWFRVQPRFLQGCSSNGSKAWLEQNLFPVDNRMIFPVDQAQSWTWDMHSPVPYVSESAMCCSTCSSCKWTRNQRRFRPAPLLKLIQGSGRFQLGSRPLLVNVHLFSWDVRAPSTRAKIVKPKWTTFSVCSGVKVPEGLNISRHFVHVQYEQDFWVLAFKMTIKNTAGMFQQLYGLP